MDEPLSTERVELGKTGIYIPPMGVGAWAWGDRIMWGFGSGYGQEDVKNAFEASIENGLIFFDTAEAYGSGRSEKFLGEFAPGGRAPSGQEVVIATKFFPFPWRLTGSTLLNALRRSLKRLRLERVDLYQIHWPLSLVSLDVWSRALGKSVQEGLTRSVGVSNYSAQQMKRAHNVLNEIGVPLASNQVEYSLLQRAPERNGVLEQCRESGATMLAYSPLGKGTLTGKYRPENPPPGLRGRQYRGERLEAISKLVQLMAEIGKAHGGHSPAQVAINWTICKGTVPLVGAKNAAQARENAGALGWRLDPSAVEELDKASSASS
jgi:aryl-alcohol dehydrogenase-like predicted oxidoreductase